MKIRTKITILFTIITATILLTFASIVYLTAQRNREKEFYALLKKEALTKANLFFDAKVSAKTLQDIYKNNRQILNEVEVAIYDTSFNLLYHDAVEIDFVKETPDMIYEIYNKSEKKFYQEDWQVIGFTYVHYDKIYIIVAAAYDQYGLTKLNSLFWNMIFIFIASIVFIYIAGLYFSKKTFDPIREMIQKVNAISATNLDLRLKKKGRKDELSELANTFNDMLCRLENSFDAQKQFVSNISHELRTPLAAIISELELSTDKEKSIDEYKSTINNALNDAKKLARLFKSLLDLAKASYDPSEISFKTLRIDEILLDARKEVLNKNTNYKINIHFEADIENDRKICINGNEYLLKTAFINLFDNGCKFSQNKSCCVFIKTKNIQYNHFNSEANSKSEIILSFVDHGIGISEEDLEHIFNSFYRGSNKGFAEGNGIGLYLTQKIIQLHRGKINIESKVGKGTSFIITLPSD